MQDILAGRALHPIRQVSAHVDHQLILTYYAAMRAIVAGRADVASSEGDSPCGERARIVLLNDDAEATAETHDHFFSRRESKLGPKKGIAPHRKNGGRKAQVDAVHNIG